MTNVDDDNAKSVYDNTMGEAQLVKSGVILYENPKDYHSFFLKSGDNPFFEFMKGLCLLACLNNQEWLSQFTFTTEHLDAPQGATRGYYIFDGSSSSDKIPWFDALDLNHSTFQVFEPSLHFSDECVSLTTVTFIKQKRGVDAFVFNKCSSLHDGLHSVNPLHLVMFQNAMAVRMGRGLGSYIQLDANATTSKAERVTQFIPSILSSKKAFSFPVINTPMDTWLGDLGMFVTVGPVLSMRDAFFRRVANPLWHAWFAWNDTKKSAQERLGAAKSHLSGCCDFYWKNVCEGWLHRQLEGGGK